MADRLVIVVPDAEVQATRDRIAELAIFGWEQHLRLAGGPVRRGGGYAARVASASKILDIVAEFGASSLIIAKEVICENKIIERRPNLYFRSLHLRVLRDRIIPRELISMGSHWREILNDRLAHWHLKRTGVDDWLGQFDELGARWVGEALLRQIDVIDPNKLIQAFQMPAKPFGINCTFTFISDADPAASSNMIGGWLTKMYGRTRVKDFVSALTTSAPGSRLVICEDALWTGTELRSLLHRLGPGGDLAEAATGKQITFRHSVVTDFGLCIVRHFLDHKELNFVDFHLDENQLSIKVLGPDVSDVEIQSRWAMMPADFEDWLTTQVRPIVFQHAALWKGQQEQAQQICAEIGRQLIDKYSRDERKNWREPVHDGFALGASRFASATVFGHSVPKVCLPMFWLEGPVVIGSASLNWKPLFYDARRTRGFNA